jgi:hypothetical protein
MANKGFDVRSGKQIRASINKRTPISRLGSNPYADRLEPLGDDIQRMHNLLSTFTHEGAEFSKSISGSEKGVAAHNNLLGKMGLSLNTEPALEVVDAAGKPSTDIFIRDAGDDGLKLVAKETPYLTLCKVWDYTPRSVIDEQQARDIRASLKGGNEKPTPSLSR